MRIKLDAIIVKMAEQKLSRKELADKCGIDYAYMCELISKQKKVTPKTIGRIAEGLGCEVLEIAEPDISS